MAVKFSNNAKTTLALALSSAATSVTVADASKFPTLGSGDYTYATIAEPTNSSNLEIVKVTAINSNTLTVVRAQQGTSALSFSSGDLCEVRVTAGTIEEAITDVSGTLAAVATSGAYSDLTGTPTNVSDFTNDSGYLASYTETDPVFIAHTASGINNGAGFLKNNGSGTWTYDNNTYLTSYTETDTLDSVTDRGATTTNAITVGNLTSTGIDVSTATGNTTFNVTNTDGVFQIQKNADDVYFNLPDTGNMVWRNGAGYATRMVLEASGNVGIGTDNPDSKLVVSNGAAASGVEFIPATGSTSLVSIERASNAFEPFRYRALDHRFETGATQSESLRIASSGKIGIGTDSPSELLTVAGTGTTARISITDTDTAAATMTGLLEFDGSDARAGYVGYVGGNMELYTSVNDIRLSTGGATRVFIKSSGDVGIGNSPVDAKMYIRGANNQGAPSTSIDSTLTLMTGTGGVGSGGELRFAALDNPAGHAAIKSSATDGGGNSQGYLDFYIRPNTADTSMTLGMRLGHQGDLVVTGNVTAYSDERLKSDIETLDGSKVYEMRGVSFTKNGEAGSGVIAQELQKVAPELVHEGEEYLSVAYGNLVGYLIEAVKELKAEIDELKGAN